jgi:hypothetical protein
MTMQGLKVLLMDGQSDYYKAPAYHKRGPKKLSIMLYKQVRDIFTHHPARLVVCQSPTKGMTMKDLFAIVNHRIGWFKVLNITNTFLRVIFLKQSPRTLATG